MPRYRYLLASPDGEREAFEGAGFGDDTTAEAYGWRLVADLMSQAPDQYRGCDLVIMRDETIVGHLSFSHYSKQQ
jgi:hypothetical protein